MAATGAHSIYPGVVARLVRSSWRQGGIVFEGSEADLRRAGLLQPGDRIPKKPRGWTRSGSGCATMLVNGKLRVTLNAIELAARDAAFARFMAVARRPNAGEVRKPPKKGTQ